MSEVGVVGNTSAASSSVVVSGAEGDNVSRDIGGFVDIGNGGLWNRTRAYRPPASILSLSSGFADRAGSQSTSTDRTVLTGEEGVSGGADNGILPTNGELIDPVNRENFVPLGRFFPGSVAGGGSYTAYRGPASMGLFVAKGTFTPYNSEVSIPGYFFLPVPGACSPPPHNTVGHLPPGIEGSLSSSPADGVSNNSDGSSIDNTVLTGTEGETSDEVITGDSGPVTSGFFEGTDTLELSGSECDPTDVLTGSESDPEQNTAGLSGSGDNGVIVEAPDSSGSDGVIEVAPAGPTFPFSNDNPAVLVGEETSSASDFARSFVGPIPIGGPIISQFISQMTTEDG